MLASRLFRLYYALKYLPLRLLRRRGPMEHKGFVGVQIDGLAHAHLAHALERGYLPRLRKKLEERQYKLHEYPAGLPSATPYAQSGILYGENENIPGFRWYERRERRVVSCNRPHSVEYVRARLGPRKGVLRGGSSYVNLIDGDADRSVLTANSAVRRTFFEEVGGFRFFLLVLLHPARILVTVIAAFHEIFLELYDRYISRRGKRDTVEEGWFPVVRVLSNVLLREIQTVAVMADVYAGVPYVFTTYASYDELAHHYGARSRPALKNLKYIFNRILEIERIIRRLPGRYYDLIVLSDHGQTDGAPFLGLFGATLGEIIHQRLEGLKVHVETGATAPQSAMTRDLVAGDLERRAERRWFLTRRLLRAVARLLSRLADVQSYLPERYYVDEDNDVVVTYSGTLALVYFSRHALRLSDDEVRRAFPGLLEFLVGHPGIGLVVTRAAGGGAVLRSARGTALLVGGELTVLDGEDPLLPYEAGPIARRALQRMAGFSNTGDLILFGAYDGQRIVCFDDQVASHGCLGGPQFWPFLLLPNDPRFDQLVITDPRDIYSQILAPYHPREEEGEGE